MTATLELLAAGLPAEPLPGLCAVALGAALPAPLGALAPAGQVAADSGASDAGAPAAGAAAPGTADSGAVASGAVAPGEVDGGSADDAVAALLRPGAVSPWPELPPLPGLSGEVRAVLRQRGYRPTGRGKPSSEYLAQSVELGRLRPINPVVDAANAVSLHSGLPISVVDVARLQPPLRIAVPAPGVRYVFNASGQEIEVGGLISLCDAAGPCANAVKDAQRTKTAADTRAVLALIWGVAAPDPGRAAAAQRWLAALLRGLGARVTAVPVRAG